MTLANRLSQSRRHLGFGSAFVLALGLAGTSSAFAQSAYQPGWQGSRSAVMVDLSVLDGPSPTTRAGATRQVEPASTDEVMVDTSVLDSLGPVEAAGARRIVLHRPTSHFASAGGQHFHFHLQQVAHTRHAHRHVAHRTQPGAIKLASAKTKGADGQCCPVPDAR
jgi:hypothetical protein